MASQTSQTVLVTGATSGIGAEVARQLVQRGHRVFGTSRNPDTVADPIAGVTYVRLDNADYASAQACADEVGAVDILINNAGESQAGALEDTPMSAIEGLFRVNVFGPIALTKAVLPGMRERGTAPSSWSDRCCRAFRWHFGRTTRPQNRRSRHMRSRPAARSRRMGFG